MSENNYIVSIKEIYDITSYTNSSICEYDKLSQNNNIVNRINLENPMQDTIYEELVTEQKGMKVRLKFPQNAKNENLIKEEVKNILSSLLQEYLRNIS